VAAAPVSRPRREIETSLKVDMALLLFSRTSAILPGREGTGRRGSTSFKPPAECLADHAVLLASDYSLMTKQAERKAAFVKPEGGRSGR
jgi:hypothetical protein